MKDIIKNITDSLDDYERSKEDFLNSSNNLKVLVEDYMRNSEDFSDLIVLINCNGMIESCKINKIEKIKDNDSLKGYNITYLDNGNNEYTSFGSYITIASILRDTFLYKNKEKRINGN